jgi:hypothetical protein
VNLVREGDPAWRKSWFYEYNYEVQFPYTPNVRAVRTDEWKYIHYPHGDGLPDRHLAEMYHLKADPEERTNLVNDSKYAAKRTELEAELASTMRASGLAPEVDEMPMDQGIGKALPDAKIRSSLCSAYVSGRAECFSKCAALHAAPNCDCNRLLITNRASDHRQCPAQYQPCYDVPGIVTWRGSEPHTPYAHHFRSTNSSLPMTLLARGRRRTIRVHAHDERSEGADARGWTQLTTRQLKPRCFKTTRMRLCVAFKRSTRTSGFMMPPLRSW